MVADNAVTSDVVLILRSGILHIYIYVYVYIGKAVLYDEIKANSNLVHLLNT